MRYFITAAAVLVFTKSVIGTTTITEFSPQQTQAVEGAWNSYEMSHDAIIASINYIAETAVPPPIFDSVLFHPDTTRPWLATTARGPGSWVTYLPSDVAAVFSSIVYAEQAIQYSVLGLPEPTALAVIESEAGAAAAAGPTNAVVLNAAGVALGAAGIVAAVL